MKLNGLFKLNDKKSYKNGNIDKFKHLGRTKRKKHILFKHIFTIFSIAFIAVVFIYSNKMENKNWILFSIGLSINVLCEQMSNVHYKYFVKKAGLVSDNIIDKNIWINRITRSASWIGILLLLISVYPIISRGI